MIETEYGPKNAPENYYVGQATVGQAIQHIKFSAQFVFWSVLVVCVVLGISSWIFSALEVGRIFDSLISIHVSTEGQAILFAAYTGWWIRQGRKKGLTWRQMIVGFLLVLPLLGFMAVAPSWIAAPAFACYWLLFSTAGSTWDDLYRCGRENCERIADLQRQATRAEAELEREWKAQTARYGRDW